MTDVRSILLEGAQRPVHMVGVCGIGMAGVAYLLSRRGFAVTGCDVATRGAMAEWLAGQGIKVYEGHDPGHIPGDTGWVIRSAAVGVRNPELSAAMARGMPVFTRGEVLAALADCPGSVAVCGTHGKTTTSAFLAQLLRNAGKDPSWCVGGESAGEAVMPPAGQGSGEFFVLEADESDGSLSRYVVDVLVLTNIEYDHMENFETEDAFRSCFGFPVGAARRAVVYCADDDGAREAATQATARCVGYGMDAAAAVRAGNLVATGNSMEFDLVIDGSCAGRVRLPVPGKHNVINACGAAAAGLELGLDVAEILKGLEKLRLPRRRFEVIRDGAVTVISDYAHHPSEIRALVSTARESLSGRICGVFQPHRYTRTRALGADFPAAFAGLDELVLVPVYAASEQPLAGGRTGDLYAQFREQHPNGVPIPLLADSLDQATAYLSRAVRQGECLLVIGAGDVEKIGEAMGEERENGRAGEWEKQLSEAFAGVKLDEPLAGKTTYKVGGAADAWVDFQTRSDLAKVMSWSDQRGVPCRILGGGSNLLVSDLGVRGICGRLAGDEFRRVTVQEHVVTVGCGCPTAKLLGELEDRGLGGLEFLDSVPGTVGGALRMNAGAWGHEVRERILSIQCLNSDGSALTVRGEDGEWDYRSCDALKGRVAVEVTFGLEQASPEGVAEARAGYRERRAWMRGMRCAGSVFRNPEGESAGRLLEAAGLKGVRIGGAAVSEAHANVIVTEDGATASDVKALLERMRETVFEHVGIQLEMEVIELG